MYLVVNKLSGHLQDVRSMKLCDNVLVSGSNDHTVKVRLMYAPVTNAE